MLDLNWIEIVGYISSTIVILSLLMSSLIKFRWLNLLGATTTLIYGILLKAYPIVGVNIIIIFIDIYFLIRFYTADEYFKLLKINRDDIYLQYFLGYYKNQIIEYFPDFDFENFEKDEDRVIFSVLRNLVTAGIFICRKNSDELICDIEFVVAEYRDFKVGRYFYSYSRDFFEILGYKEYKTLVHSENRRLYLLKIGFEERVDDSGNKFYTKKVVS